MTCCQSFKIRVIDSSNGRPIPNQQVVVSFLYDKQQLASSPSGNSLNYTDPIGEVLIALPDPAPGHISVIVHLTSEHWHCGCFELVDTQELMKKGVVSNTGRSKAGPTISASAAIPGYIQMSARPYTLFERLLAPLLKE